MRVFLLVFCLLFTLTSCDDGDVITVDLDFEDTFSSCGDIVFFKTKADPAESLSLEINDPALVIADFIETEVVDNVFVALVNPELTFSINGNSNTFNYRTYNSEPVDFFCTDTPLSGITIISDQPSTTGTAEFITTLTEDDNDGIFADNEDSNGNDNLLDDDYDNDGIPNYLDADDDGDNVLTIDEDINNDGNFENDDSDGDGTPDYLDTDDDGDGVLTRDEENDTQDQNPTNDRTDLDNPTVPDYLNPDIATTVAATAYRENSISQTFTVTLMLTNIQLPTLTQESFNFGTLNNSTLSNTRTITPEFN